MELQEICLENRELFICKLKLVIIILLWSPCAVESGEPTDIRPNLVYFNEQNTTQGSQFKSNLNVVMGFLYKETPLNGSANYGYGKYPDVVFGHAECFNMSQGDCGQCFNTARDEIDAQAPLTVGAQLWVNDTTYRCYLRFENYNFIKGYEIPVDAPAPTPQQQQGVASQRGGGSSKTKILIGVIVGVVSLLALLCLVLFLRFSKRTSTMRTLDESQSSTLRYRDGLLEAGLEGPTVYTFDDLRLATDNFSEGRKLGQGGFGAVYKGVLADGSEVAVKKLSLQSSQGKEAFVNEVNIITGVQQRNLARLRGYCIKGDDERLLVYEFLQNGSLDRRLFDGSLDWRTRYNIAIGIARGLAYLHEESHIQIIHRDIKASNILLDKDLMPKISDFGISKLFAEDRSSIDTRIAGTYGYMAPEYAIGGRLTVKADVFSFGVLLLEIISGRRCRTDQDSLLEQLWRLYETDNLEELVDKRLNSAYSRDEALRSIDIALLCTHEEEGSRPAMSDVVAMFLGYLKLAPLPTKSPWYFGLKKHSNSDQTTSRSSDTFSQSSEHVARPR